MLVWSVMNAEGHSLSSGWAILRSGRQLKGMEVPDSANGTHEQRGLVHPYDMRLGCRRMEAYKRSGKRLKGMEVAQCANGPHELRGVVRNDLQSTLASRLPAGVIRTGAGITGVSHFDDGEHAGSCAKQSDKAPHWKKESGLRALLKL